MTRSLLLALLLALTVAPSLAKPEPPADWKAALAKLREARSYDDEAVGIAGIKSATWIAFEVFRDGAPSKRLVELTEDDNAVVRCYAVRALVAKRFDVDLFAILRNHLGDEAEVDTFQGCIMSKRRVGDVMIDAARELLPKNKLHELHSALALNTKSVLDERPRSLRTEPFDRSMAPALRKLAAGGDTAALVALARLTEAEDAPLIVSALRGDAEVAFRAIDALLAAELFPHPSIRARLVELKRGARRFLERHGAVRARFWFRALAGQRHEQSAAVLIDLLDAKSRSGRVVDSVAEAIADDLVPAHDPIRWILWEKHGLLDESGLERLGEIDAARARAQCVRDLAPGRVNAADSRLTDARLDRIAATDPEEATALLARALPAAGHGPMQALCRAVALRKSPSLVEPLFGVVASRTNPHQFLWAVRALLVYDDRDIDARLEKLIAARPELRSSWGGKRLEALMDDRPRAWPQ